MSNSTTYEWLSQDECMLHLDEAKIKKVSKVSRGAGGFMRTYLDDPTLNPDAMSKLFSQKHQSSWGQVRINFIKRHTAQYEKNPTRRRWLSLIMWAYRVPGEPPAS